MSTVAEVWLEGNSRVYNTLVKYMCKQRKFWPLTSCNLLSGNFLYFKVIMQMLSHLCRSRIKRLSCYSNNVLIRQSPFWKEPLLDLWISLPSLQRTFFFSFFFFLITNVEKLYLSRVHLGNGTRGKNLTSLKKSTLVYMVMAQTGNPNLGLTV